MPVKIVPSRGPVRVERPSRTLFEELGEGGRSLLSLFVWFWGTLIVAAILQLLIPSSVPKPVRASLVAIFTLSVLGYRFVYLPLQSARRRVRAGAPVVRSHAPLWMRLVGWLGLGLVAGIFVSGLVGPNVAAVAGLGVVAFGFRGEILSLIPKRPSDAASIAEAAPEAASERQAERREPSGDDTILGIGLDNGEALRLDRAMRNRHCYVVGKTRTGKTTLLKVMAYQDMLRGEGLAFIDPHGDAAEELLGAIPSRRIEDVLYLDPTKPDSPSFNPFALPYSPPKLTEDVVSVFRLLVGGDSWGPRMEHMLRFGTLTLLADPNVHTLRDLRRLYLDEGFRNEIVGRLENEQLREFWDTEYPTIPQGAANPILNKLSAFLAPMSDLERVFSRKANDLDFTKILAEGKILIVNLAKGALGDEPARLLGGLIVAGLQQAALARASLPVEERSDFHLFVDEFHNFTVSSFESILSESAKYRLSLTLANQTLGQLSSSLQSSIFGNCGTIVAFQVSAEDAPALRKEMHRSRILVRTEGKSEFGTLSDFVAYQRDVYSQALQDRYLGLTVEDRRALRKQEEKGIRAGWEAGELMNERRREIARVLDLLAQESIEVEALRELFPDYEFRELSFPEVDDFLNLAPYHAFSRIGSAENVTAIRCLPTNEPGPERREAARKALARYARPEEEKESRKPSPRSSKQEPETFRE